MDSIPRNPQTPCVKKSTIVSACSLSENLSYTDRPPISVHLHHPLALPPAILLPGPLY